MYYSILAFTNAPFLAQLILRYKNTDKLEGGRWALDRLHNSRHPFTSAQTGDI